MVRVLVSHLNRSRYSEPTSQALLSRVGGERELADRLRALEGVLDAETMRQMNAAVDLAGESPGQVARDWLRRNPVAY